MSNKEATTTAIAKPSFLDALDQLPADIPGAATFEPGRIIWLHGVNAGGAKTPGMFYAKDTAFAVPPDAPWVPDDRYAERDETGYSAAQINIAIIAERSQWFIPGKEVGDSSTWITEYQSGSKKLTEYLIRVQGVDDLMVLSVSGLYKARPIADLISKYRSGALAQAMRRVKRSLPLWSFWLPVANQLRDGKTNYIKATDASGKEYGSVVTPPALAGTPIPRSSAEIVADSDVWQQFKDAGWLAFKRLPRDTTEAEYVITTEAVPALPPGRNVPVAISVDDDDLPF